MASKIRYGKVEVSDASFDNENALVRISLMLPLQLVQELKRLSLTPEHGGKYQVLIRDVLSDWASHQKKAKRRRA